MKITGPFKQIVTLANLPLRGKLADEQLEIIENGGILSENGKIVDVGNFNGLKTAYPTAQIENITGSQVALPAFTDAHTHICFGGNLCKPPNWG